MATSKGLALVFGTKATVKVYDSANLLPLVAGIATLESMDITHECDTEQVKNSSGEVVANVSAGDRLSATLKSPKTSNQQKFATETYVLVRVLD